MRQTQTVPAFSAVVAMAEGPFTETVPPEEPASAPIRIFAPGTEIADRYEVRRALGTGGSAVVYAVFDRELKREVALKVLRPERMGEAALKRFRREVGVARDAQSPRLVRVFDIGHGGDVIYLTMELVEGGSLRERLKDGALPLAEVLRIGRQILEGLQVLHRLGIVHRDIKPGNVLLTSEGDVKLADFGLARHWEREESRATATDAMIGTLEYLSPEQALGRELDARSDLYSFGVVLFEMLTGKVPYEGESSLATLLARLKGRPPEVSRLRPEVPRWLAGIASRLLERDRARRYASADAVLRDLESHRGRRWLPPRRRALALASLAAVVVGCAAWYQSWQGTRFSYLVVSEGKGARAVAANGQNLWSRPDLNSRSRYAMVRLKPGARPYIAAILGKPDDFDVAVRQLLSVIDPQSGGLVRQVRFPDGSASFRGFSNRYEPILRATDLDGDGADEVIVTYEHRPWWPSYAVLYEPTLDRARLIFQATGHHKFIGAADVDGDKRKELIFAGPNNVLGWYNGVAAVRAIPPIGQVTRGGGTTSAGSPGMPYGPGPREALARYCLLPDGAIGRAGEAVSIDENRRRVRIEYATGRRISVDFDGFLEGDRPGIPAAERSAARDRAYARMHEALRLLLLGLPGDARGEANAALGHARKAADHILAEWIERLQGRILVAAGRYTEAEAKLEAVAKTSEADFEITFDAARAFHLRGELGRALAWYRRGVRHSEYNLSGRQNHLFGGMVLALGELGRWSDATKEIDQFSSYLTSQAWFRAYVRWRTGLRPVRPSTDSMPAAPADPFPYWGLEFGLADGEDAGRLLKETEVTLPLASGSRGLILSLKGELLSRLGRREEALIVAREAYEAVRVAARSDTTARAHFDLVTERYAHLAERAGNLSEAAEARWALREFRRERRTR